MTLFEQLKKDGVPGKTILVDDDVERYFMGFNPVNDLMITVRIDDAVTTCWFPRQIENCEDRYLVKHLSRW